MLVNRPRYERKDEDGNRAKALVKPTQTNYFAWDSNNNPRKHIPRQAQNVGFKSYVQVVKGSIQLGSPSAEMCGKMGSIVPSASALMACFRLELTMQTQHEPTGSGSKNQTSSAKVTNSMGYAKGTNEKRMDSNANSPTLGPLKAKACLDNNLFGPQALHFGIPFMEGVSNSKNQING
ncbi:hypothetical protein VNO78_09985 [Psophocarpus tetragonolobus]|uniref:Uncharacterized protein n=1 Tax=Psophocarpus tetragonolobus TaxID=3891 RepID=A0AAN9XMH4_PSOTE